MMRSLLLALPLLAAGSPARAPEPVQTTEFARLVARLSEPGGYFDSDNLISNETSYLHAVSKLRALGVSGGAYVGVGPDQSFSYLAAIRPTVAYLIDIRRDNLLMHLMFKALFERSRNRLEYLCRWLGRPVPGDAAAWRDRPIEEIIARVDSLTVDPASATAESAALLRLIATYGVPLSSADSFTIQRFHSEFTRLGLNIRFTSAGRAPRTHYPTLRQLILERDLEGGQANYLATRDGWDFLKELQSRNRIIPVVGDLAGSRAFPAISLEIATRGERVSALYVSNVEMYLWRDGRFDAFARTAAALPRDSHSVIIRSVFGGGGGQFHPLNNPGHVSTQLVQALDDFADRHRRSGWTSYWDLVTLGNR
ncbi:MAG TPA: hypothetical protein VFN96_02275 [Gemmatimonadales bacterium]|nr:hypothetical protein [Gemmatimonadales bacterium]